jgi:hypothetical protein
MVNPLVKKIIVYSLPCLLIVAMLIGMLPSCNKPDPYLGCGSSKLRMQCNINGNEFVADSTACLYDSTDYTVYLYALDSSIKAQLLFTLRYTMKSADLRLINKDSVYTGKLIGYLGNQYFESKYGNIGITVEDGKVCGQFFSQSNGVDISVTDGKFSAIPWYTLK